MWSYTCMLVQHGNILGLHLPPYVKLKIPRYQQSIYV